MQFTDGKLVVNEEQAKTVSYIFRRFLEGKTPYSIAQELMELKMKTATGKLKWCSEDIVRTLKNEKYCGNAILQKTYKKDLLSKRETNNGEVRKFFVENGHPAIITPEQFDMAQQELEERKKEKRQHSSKSIFTSRLICGCCGGYYGSKVWHSTDKYRTVIWQCNDKFKKEEKCTTPHLKEDQIKEIYLKAVNQLITDKEPALEMTMRLKTRIEDVADLESKLQKADERFLETMVLFQDYISKNAITEAELNDGRYAELERQYSSAKEVVDGLRDELTARTRRAAALGRFIVMLEGLDDVFEEFTDEIWLGLADTITIKEKGSYVVKYKSGMEIPVEY